MTNKRRQITAAARRHGARRKDDTRRIIARLEAADDKRAAVPRHSYILEENTSSLHAELRAARRDLDLRRAGDSDPIALFLLSVLASVQLAEAALGRHDLAHRTSRPVANGLRDSLPRSHGSSSPGRSGRGTSPGSSSLFGGSTGPLSSSLFAGALVLAPAPRRFLRSHRGPRTRRLGFRGGRHRPVARTCARACPLRSRSVEPDPAVSSPARHHGHLGIMGVPGR